MKKILLFLSAVLLALLAPAYARAEAPAVTSKPTMLTMFGGAGIVMGITQEEDVAKLHQAAASFMTYSGCERLGDEIDGPYRNYIADNPIQSEPSAAWLQGLGKAVGADYVTLVWSELSGFKAPGYFHTSVKAINTTTIRIIRTSDGSTLLNAEARRDGKIEAEALQCALAALENAKQVEKENHIIFVKK